MSEAYIPPPLLNSIPATVAAQAQAVPTAPPTARVAGRRKRTVLVLFTVVTLAVVAVVFLSVDNAVANGLFNSGTGNCGGG